MVSHCLPIAWAIYRRHSDVGRESTGMDFAAFRKNMVQGQLMPRRVIDPRVIEAMSVLPRETFVPKSVRGLAYMDEAVPIGRNRHLMEPNLLARLLQAAEVEPGDMGLWIGCGSGYGAAVLARLCQTVVAVESDSELAKRAMESYAELAIDNVVVEEGGLDRGSPAQAPYDVIVFGGAVPRIPEQIKDQLADGGRLVAVLSGPEAVGRAVRLVRVGDVVSETDLFDAGTPALPGFTEKKGFVF